MIVDSSTSILGGSRLIDSAGSLSPKAKIQSDVPTTAAAQTSSPAAVPVSNSATLSTATSAALLSLTQETNSSDTSASASQQASSGASQSAGTESDITQVAQDPAAAENWIRQQISGPVLVFVSADTLPNAARAARNGDFRLQEQLDNASKLSRDVYQQKLSLYQTDTSAGKSSTQIMGDLLKFNADLPSSYWQTLDQSDTLVATKAAQATQQVQQAQADLAAYQQQTQTA